MEGFKVGRDGRGVGVSIMGEFGMRTLEPHRDAARCTNQDNGRWRTQRQPAEGLELGNVKRVCDASADEISSQVNVTV